MAVTLAPLPPYPSTRARASLSPSQSSSLLQTIFIALSHVLCLDDAKINSPSTIAFIASYVKDAARQTLQSLIWGVNDKDRTPRLSQTERKIRHTVFVLAERLAPLGALDLQTLIDLSVAYARVSPSRIRALFSAAFVQSPKSSALLEQVQNSGIPAFTTLLSAPSQGLYGLRKTAHIILCLLRPAPADLARLFARNKTFMRGLATAYDAGLTSSAQTYGGFRSLFAATSEGGQTRELDEWERLFLETKVDLLDTFHILVRTLLDDVASIANAGPALAAQAEPAFEIVFDLLEVRASPSGGGSADNVPPTPFLNRPLLADYQHAYDFSRTLADVMRRTEDARADLLESTLRTMSSEAGSGSRAGALKLILRSSGVPPGIDNLGRGPAGKSQGGDVKGKGKDVGQQLGSGAIVAPHVSEEQLDMALAQVLDLFPDQDPTYIRSLLAHPDYPYKGDAEKLIGALLEGAAPSSADVEAAIRHQAAALADVETQSSKQMGEDEYTFTKERRNVFDDDAMDLSKVKIGKKSEDTQIVLQDRSFIEEMKADILRRAEEISDDEDEEGEDGGKGKGRDLAYEEDLEDADVVKVLDGDPSELEGGESEADGEADGTEIPRNPEAVLEQAYIRDPKLFERDGQTRRSKGRADLKAQTGMTDEQIEGWRIMLERDPKKKENLLAKYEFTGNKPLAALDPSEAGPSGSRGGGGRGGGRGRGRGGRGTRGRGAGGGGGGDGVEGGNARDRSWKDKNKASRANHNRKRGHDKKMARVGGPG
ncbi:hypothetical protein BN946_scf184830.g28 [Trametes cinnabarina]|uniref:CUE domain-containing protein n=1 Tax=Pycnoporus cinnabarinus TaxID=5643 RepID=A0A060S9U2_PYCCI|nr:hypothetical protein BN946_scf184830.g28 [Trametes cinnabarina]